MYERRLRHLDRAVVVTVTAVRVMQVAVDQEIGVVVVRHSHVAAGRTVLVGLVVAAATVLRGALGRVDRVDGQLVLLDVLAVDVMQMAVVQIIDVAIVLDGRVAAVGAVLVRVVRMNRLSSCHDSPFLGGRVVSTSGPQWATGQLLGVLPRVKYQIGDVPIRQCVKNMRPLPAACDDALDAKGAEPLRDCRELLFGGRDDFGHAELSLRQHFENLQTGRVGKRTQQSCRSFEGGETNGVPWALPMCTGFAARSVVLHGSFHYFIN